jgi:hypothetical protein
MKSDSQKAQVSLFMRSISSAQGLVADIRPRIEANQCAHCAFFNKPLLRADKIVPKADLQLSRPLNLGAIVGITSEKQVLMDHKQRYRRLRLLVGKLNKERKQQAKKIDILCNDIIAAQRDFIKRLDTISFTANFYETIAGTTEVSNLILLASKLIKEETADANVAFFLRQASKFELHIFESTQPILLEKQELENCFTPEVVEAVCKSNKICTLDDMFAMGLQGSPTRLNEITAATIPLSRGGRSLGFILVYRTAENKLTDDELNNIAAISPGLSRAIASCQEFCHSAG